MNLSIQIFCYDTWNVVQVSPISFDYHWDVVDIYFDIAFRCSALLQRKGHFMICF